MSETTPRIPIEKARRVLDCIKAGGAANAPAVYASLVVTGDLPPTRGYDLAPPVHIRMPVGTWETRKP